MALACSDGLDPDPGVPAVETLVVEAVSLAAVRLEWAPVGGPDVINYRIERRANLTGPFVVVAANVPQSTATTIVYFDVGLEPDTYYGYRVIAQSRFGDRALPSLVRAARTPPPPAVLVTTSTALTTPASIDPDGYTAFLKSTTDSAIIPIGPTGQVRFGPLPAGLYTVELRGLAPQCGLDGSRLRSASVADQGVRTVDTVRYVVACRDPGLGRLTVIVNASGDSLDANGYAVQLVGRTDDPGPDSLVSFHYHFDSLGGQRTADLLRPGSYAASFDSLAPHCALDGAAVRGLAVGPLSDDTVRYAVTCQGSNGGGGAGPYVWRHTWSAAVVPPGQRVSLDVTLDLNANPAERISTVQSVLQYNAGALRFDSATAGGLGNGFVANGATPGQVIWADFAFSPPGGLITLTRLHFTAMAAAGATSTARSTITQLLAADEATELDTLVRFVEDTVSVGSGTANQPPTAEANGPYAATAGTPVAFTAAGSNDPDGTIVGWSWTFGDGGAATGPAPSHVYTAAGSYAAVLTVTDNLGATDTDAATVTVTAPGQTTPFTWTGAFGTINPVDSVVALTLTLDLTTDIVETAGTEQLATWVVDSLKWNTAVLRYHAFNWGPGGAGVVNPTDALTQGKLVFSSFTMPATNNSGVIALATIRFKVIGAPASSTTTVTALGPLTGTAATGAYPYRPRTRVQEATLAVP
jgi:PKD repeat protein